MKKFVLNIGALFLFFSHGFSQQIPVTRQSQPVTQFKRCATMQRVDMLFKAFPERKLLAEKLSKEIPPQNTLRVAKRLQSVVYVPVVFHIVLPNPYLITEEVVQSQIAALNTDFAGMNADSTNIPAAFQAIRGHSMIQFVLARKTPSGALTNGIERITSSTTGNPNIVTDSIKRASLGGADAWDPNSYVNIWVGNVSNNDGTLGYTQIPGSGVPADDGIFCNILGFGISSCNPSEYNKARTVVHEMGNYFGLFNIWGDDESDSNKCSGDDFRALTTEGSTYTLPPSLYNPPGQGNTSKDIGDTPNQAIATSNCPSGTVTDQCTSVAPGILYQDYMDYTLDNCYSMFTKKQVERMEYVLTTYRSGLLSSAGGTAPANAPIRDAAPLSSINPGGIETSGCSSIFHPATMTCAGSFTPKVLIVNNGLNPITSITVGYRINGGAPVTVNLSTNLSFGATQMVTFPSITVSTGNFTFTFFTTNVNGAGADQVPGNDSLTATLNVPNPVPLPLSEGFENSAFPPVGWNLINPYNNSGWQLTTPGHNSAHSIFIDNYDNNVAGQWDEIRTPKLTLSNTDPVVITFDLAYKNYPNPQFNDSLNVLVSTDCGATFKSYFNKAGAALATADTSSSAYVNPAPGDWATQKITLDGSLLSSGNIIVAFRATSDYGNNIFIDNINVKQETSRDLAPVAINPPAATDCAEPTVPVVTIKNVGFSTITAFKVDYQIDNGPISETTVTGISLAANAQMNVPLNTFTPTQGNHVITVFTTQPVSSSGTGDETPANDTIRKAFFVTGKVTPPITEGFENPVFPPATWSIENPDGGITWQRTTVAAKTGTASMVINNFNASSTGTINSFISSIISGTSTFDSMFVSFDYAYAARTSSGLQDTLELQITTDCGQTFTTVWKNGGRGLQTTANNSSTAFIPTANDWKNVSLNLFPYVGTKDFQIYFVDKGNKQNNLYIDNINLYGVTVPQLLKEQGYLFYPNPFHNQFYIRNYQVPVNLQAAHIYNSVGQLIWSKAYNGNAYTLMPVDLSGAAPGVYIIKLQYTNRTVVQKIVKN
ncbi:MAG: choice-of-anchor J domain-containing protein [Ginsengibacter sp.]